MHIYKTPYYTQVSLSLFTVIFFDSCINTHKHWIRRAFSHPIRLGTDDFAVLLLVIQALE